MCGCLLHIPYWALALNPDMCPDWELNRQPFGLQAGTQSTEPYHPGLITINVKKLNYMYMLTIQKQNQKS